MDIGLRITIKLQLDDQLLLLVLTFSVVSTLCSPMGCRPRGSCTHGIFQARILEWGAISYARGSFPPRGKTVAVVAPTFFITSVTWEALTSLELLNESSSVNHSALMGKSKCLNMASGADLQLSSSLTSIQPAWLFSSPNVTSYFFFCHVTCGVLVPQPRIKPMPPDGVLATGLPQKSSLLYFHIKHSVSSPTPHHSFFG